MAIRTTAVERAAHAAAGAVGRRPRVAGAGGACLIAFSGIYVRLSEASPTTAATFRCAYAVPVLALIAYAERRRFGPQSARSMRLAAVAGLLFAADLIFWHVSIGYVGAGLSTVLANLQVVLVALLAWLLLGERPGLRVLLAIPVVLGGVVLISGVTAEAPYGDDPVLGVVFGVLTALAYAGFFLVLRAGNIDPRRPAGPLLVATVVTALASAAAGAVTGDVDLAPAWPGHGWLLLLALSSQVTGWLLISISLPRLPAAVTAVILLLQPAGAVVLGMVLLGEAPSAIQLAGVLLVLAGVTAANLRRRSAPRGAIAGAAVRGGRGGAGAPGSGAAP